MIPDERSPTPASPATTPARRLPEAAEAKGEAPAPNPLTPEEQMALFEQELKEQDWGHQPC